MDVRIVPLLVPSPAQLKRRNETVERNEETKNRSDETTREVTNRNKEMTKRGDDKTKLQEGRRNEANLVPRVLSLPPSRTYPGFGWSRGTQNLGANKNVLQGRGSKV